MKKQLFLLPIFTLLAAGALHAAPGGGPPQRPVPAVTTGKVVEADDVESRRYSGLVLSPAVVQLVPRVSGELLEIGFKDGDFVKKGQMLYKFDPIRYEAEVKSAEAKIAECRARLEYAQNNYDRTHTLYSKQATSKDSMENTLSALEAFKSAMRAAEAALITAQDDLKNTVIYAPMDGLIGVTNYTPGNYITPNSGVLCTINQIAPLRVRFAMSNRDYITLFGSLESLKSEANIALKLADDSRYEEAGAVELIDNEANRQTDTIQIFARFPNAGRKLLPGSTVTVLLTKNTGVRLPAVRPSAVMHDSYDAYVYTLDAENQVVRRDVKLGSDLGDLILIKSGLKSGETVIVDGTHKVMPGEKVAPVAQED